MHASPPPVFDGTHFEEACRTRQERLNRGRLESLGSGFDPASKVRAIPPLELRIKVLSLTRSLVLPGGLGQAFLKHLKRGKRRQGEKEE